MDKRLPPVRVAIVGGGITGAVAASTLLDAARTGFAEEGQPRLVVELFDQGRRGPGRRRGDLTYKPARVCARAGQVGWRLAAHLKRRYQ